MALNREEIVDQTVVQFSGDAEVLNNRIYFNNRPQYQDTAPEQYNAPDPDGAKALLEESGYTLGADGVYEHPDRGRLSLAISTTVNNPLRQQTIDVYLRNQPSWKPFLPSATEGEFTMPDLISFTGHGLDKVGG